jgi:hypothetical protein
MRPVTQTQTGAGSTTPIQLDGRSNPFSVGIGCVVSGTVNYSVEHAFENPPVNWFQNANISDLTANADTNYMFPVAYIRLTVNSGSGSVTMTVLQSGPT